MALAISQRSSGPRCTEIAAGASSSSTSSDGSSITAASAAHPRAAPPGNSVASRVHDLVVQACRSTR